MFGYVRPLKPELLVREFSRYKSIYCGICKQIGHDYGQLPRLALGYDLTMLAVLLLSQTDRQPPDDPAGCIVSPWPKRPIARGGPVLELCAALTVLLAWHKAADDVRDEPGLRSRAVRAAFNSSHRKAARRYPDYDQIIAEELHSLNELEKGEPDLAAAAVFGRLLGRIFQLAAPLVVSDAAIQAAIGLFGSFLGQWIYHLDAIDDWQGDCDNGRWNPYSRMTREQAWASAAETMTALELEMDRTAALLPYQRDGGLLANIVTQGLPATREQIFRGEKLKRL